MTNIGHTLLRSRCKVNLTLTITGKRADGYHTISSLFWPVDTPYDTLTLEQGVHGAGLTIHCDREDIDTNNNTLTKAYTAFAQATHFAPDIDLTLVKGVPSGAGLGGGSADAGTFLLWMNKTAPNPLNEVQLNHIAASVGADVPFFLQDKPCIAEGIGDILTPRPDLQDCLKGWTLLILCPNIAVSTPWAYRAWDFSQGESICLTKKKITSIFQFPHAGEEFGLPFSPQNGFESVVFAEFPELAQLKNLLLEQGASSAVMSGSGSSICGLFAPNADIRQAVQYFTDKGIMSYINVI